MQGVKSEHGHIVGTVMRIASSRASSTRGISYEIAWDYMELGESVVEGSKLVDACIIGSRIQSIRKQDSGVSNQETTRQNLFPQQSKTSNLRQLLANYSDDDSFGAALGSSSDRLSEDDCSWSNLSICDEEDDLLEWMLFGTREEEVLLTQELHDCDETSFIQLHGLHWETDGTIKPQSCKVMNYRSSEVHDDYKHLFTSLIDSMFAVIPLVFWEVMLEEVNRYANDYIRNEKRDRDTDGDLLQLTKC